METNQDLLCQTVMIKQKTEQSMTLLTDTFFLFWTSSIINFLKKHSVSEGGCPFSGKEAHILVYPLNRAFLSHCITKSSCLNKRQSRAWQKLPTQSSYFGLHPASNFLRKHNVSEGGSPFSGKEVRILVYSLDWAFSAIASPSCHV